VVARQKTLKINVGMDAFFFWLNLVLPFLSSFIFVILFSFLPSFLPFVLSFPVWGWYYPKLGLEGTGTHHHPFPFSRFQSTFHCILITLRNCDDVIDPSTCCDDVIDPSIYCDDVIHAPHPYTEGPGGYDWRYGGIRPQDNPDMALYPEVKKHIEALYVTENTILPQAFNKVPERMHAD